MAKCTITHGATSVIRHVRGLSSTATDGAGKTGLAFGDIAAKYVKPGGTLTALTVETVAVLGTYAAPTSNTHLRFKELANADPTKGVYELHFHNDWFASGTMFTLFLSAAGMADLVLEVELKASPALASVCTEARLAELAAENLPADIDKLVSRLTAARASYLDNLASGAALKVLLAAIDMTDQADITMLLGQIRMTFLHEGGTVIVKDPASPNVNTFRNEADDADASVKTRTGTGDNIRKVTRSAP